MDLTGWKQLNELLNKTCSLNNVAGLPITAEQVSVGYEIKDDAIIFSIDDEGELVHEVRFLAHEHELTLACNVQLAESCFHSVTVVYTMLQAMSEMGCSVDLSMVRKVICGSLSRYDGVISASREGDEIIIHVNLNPMAVLD